MFGIFGKKKQDTETTASAPVQQPVVSHYMLSDDEQSVFDAMKVDAEGFVRLDDVTHGLLHQQSQYISRYMENDGSEKSPFLAEGLRIDNNSISYHEYRIHKDDAIEFVARVRAFRNR